MGEREIAPILGHYGLDIELFDGWRGVRCPFHDDRRASARANVSGFACLACGVKGDAISLIMEVEHIDFSRALALYEEWSGDRDSRVRQTVKRKSWGIPPFGKRDYEGDSGGFSSRVRRKPFDGR